MKKKLKLISEELISEELDVEGYTPTDGMDYDDDMYRADGDDLPQEETPKDYIADGDDVEVDSDDLPSWLQ